MLAAGSAAILCLAGSASAREHRALGSPQLVSVVAADVPALGTEIVRVAADGRVVAFTAPVVGSHPGQTTRQVFVRDLARGTTELVSVDTTGGYGDGDSTVSSVSGDGRLVAFASSAADLVPGDGNDAGDVFVRDLTTGATTRVSVAPGGVETIGGDSFGGFLSGDGTRIVFSSQAGNLVAGDTNGLRDVFVRDLVADTVRRVSVSSGGRQSVWPVFDTAISADGRHVTFISTKPNLTDPDARHRVSVFIHNLGRGTTERVTVARGGGLPNAGSLGGPVSANGRFVVFYSRADNLVSGDRDARSDVFIRDRKRDRTELVSVGGAGSGSRRLGSVLERSGAAVSRDGRFVTFSSDERLVGADRDTRNDGYIRDRRADTLTRVKRALELQLGPGRRHVTSISRGQLSAADTDVVADAYRTRFR
jgi:Tol biopolymer transport system component